MLYSKLLKIICTIVYSIIIIPGLHSFQLYASDFRNITFTITTDDGKLCTVRHDQDIREHKKSILKQLSIASIKPSSTGFTREYLKDLNDSHFFPLRYKLLSLTKERFNSLFSEELSELAQEPIILQINNILSFLSAKNNNSHQQYKIVQQIKTVNKLCILDDSACTKINEAAKIITAARQQLPGCNDAHTHNEKRDLINKNFDIIKENFQPKLDIITEGMLFRKLYIAGQKENKAVISKEVLNPIIDKIDRTDSDKNNFISSILQYSNDLKKNELTSKVSLFLEKEFESIVKPHYNNPMLILGLDNLAHHLVFDRK